jgi:KUP system potassium uptake protein
VSAPAKREGKAVPAKTNYFHERERLLPRGIAPMTRWRTQVFVLTSRNARPATEFFGPPSSRVVERGAQIEC